MAPKQYRTRPCDLDDISVRDLLKNNIYLGQCKPAELWRVKKITKNGVTSDWAAINKNLCYAKRTLGAIARPCTEAEEIPRGVQALPRQQSHELDCSR